jgi:pilus assembly protein FimV
MSVTMPRLLLLACLLSPACLWPSLSWALGLGDIHLNSALNEPLSADIDLIAAGPDELAALRASMADRDAFTRYGIDRPPMLSSITFKVGKGKNGRDALLVRSSDAIAEPFVTFLVEVNWARGRLLREYTVLLDPPVYSPGETASTAAPVAAPTAVAPLQRPPVQRPPVQQPAPAPRMAPAVSHSSAAGSSGGGAAGGENVGPITGNTYRVAEGDTLIKIARSLRAAPQTPANIDQTMMALYRANPDAFGGNINILRRGVVLRVPGADDIAALNEAEAMGEVHRQMDTWHATGAAPPNGHLRLVTPNAGGTGAGTAATGGNAPAGDNQGLKDRVKDLESQLAEAHRLLDIRNGELNALQHKLAAPPVTPPAAVPPAQTHPAPTVQSPTVSAPPVTAVPPAATAPPATAAPPVAAAPPVVTAPPPVPEPKKPIAETPADTGSWIDWVAGHWWVPAAVILALIALLGSAMW